MKKIINKITALITVLSFPVSSVHAAESYQTADMDGLSIIYFLNENSEAVITEIRGEYSEIKIPQEIDGFKVTGIDDYAFFEKSRIISATLPDSIESIGNYAFSGCLALKNINIPENLSYLGKGAFMCCTSLESIEINGNITEIPENCFASCINLSYADIPLSVTGIGEKAFFACTALDDITLSSNVINLANCCIGAYSNARSGISYNENFTLYSENNPQAEKYAAENSLSFKNIIKGDINGDNIIDSGDASSILAEYSKLSTDSPASFRAWQKIAADVDGNLLTDSSDASEILKIYARNQTGSN